MRADRLVAALLIMQVRGQVTAAELAAELGVSVATARRDLEALSTAGLPVYPQSGRGGGWRLLGGGRTDLSGLSSTEIRALFLLVGPASHADDDARSALRKLVRALPETFRAQAEAAAEATAVDAEAWAPGGGSGAADGLVRRLQDAVVGRRRVALRYAGWDRPAADLLVDPWRLIQTPKAWYLLGAVDGSARTFRVDRVRGLEVTTEPSSRPSPAEVDAAWSATTVAVRARTTRARARIRAAPEVTAWLRTQLQPGRLEVTGDEVTVSAPSAEMVARVLTGWADRIEVLDPPELRAEIHRLGAAAAERNGSTGGLSPRGSGGRRPPA